jgi:hypothetical protein
LGSGPHHVTQHPVENIDHAVDFVIADRECRHETERIRPGPVDQQSTLASQINDPAGDFAPQAEGKQQAPAPHFPAFVTLRQLAEGVREVVARLFHPNQEPELGDRLDHRASHGRHQRIAAKRAALVTILETTDVAMGEQRGQQQGNGYTVTLGGSAVPTVGVRVGSLNELYLWVVE